MYFGSLLCMHIVILFWFIIVHAYCYIDIHLAYDLLLLLITCIVIMLHCDKMFGYCEGVTQSMSISRCHVHVYSICKIWLQFAEANLIGGGACVTQLIRVIIVLISIGIDFKRHCILFYESSSRQVYLLYVLYMYIEFCF